MESKQAKILTEEQYHNQVAKQYTAIRKADYIWEIPEFLVLFNKSFFPPDVTIVDMGCGPATVVKKLILKFSISNYRYIGIDISEKMLNEAKKNIIDGTFIKADISRIRLKKKSCDVILSLGALHHIDKYVNAVRLWIPTLKKNGYILFREPTIDALPPGKGASPNEKGIDVNILLKVLKALNLRVINLTFFSTKIFHIFNRILIGIGLGKWQKIRILWYPVSWIDFQIARFGNKLKLCKGEAFLLVAQKK